MTANADGTVTVILTRQQVAQVTGALYTTRLVTRSSDLNDLIDHFTELTAMAIGAARVNE